MPVSAISKIWIFPISSSWWTGDEKILEKLEKKGYKEGGIGCVVVIETKKGETYVAPSLWYAGWLKADFSKVVDNIENIDLSFSCGEFIKYEAEDRFEFSDDYGCDLVIHKALETSPGMDMPYPYVESILFYVV
jgi:hypothetical protein